MQDRLDMLPKDFQTVRNAQGAPGASAASFLSRTAPGTAIDQEHTRIDQGASCDGTDSRLTGYLRHQERFLFEVLRQGQLPMRNVLELGPESGGVPRWLAHHYPSARVATVDPATEQFESTLHRRADEILHSAAPRPDQSYDVAIAIEVFQTHSRARVRALVERLSAVSRYVVNIDWSEPWPWKTPEGLWCHEYQALYVEAGLNCAAFLLPETTNGMQQKLFVASRRMTPEMIRLMNRAEEDTDGF